MKFTEAYLLPAEFQSRWLIWRCLNIVSRVWELNRKAHLLNRPILAFLLSNCTSFATTDGARKAICTAASTGYTNYACYFKTPRLLTIADCKDNDDAFSMVWIRNLNFFCCKNDFVKNNLKKIENPTSRHSLLWKIFSMTSFRATTFSNAH